MVNPYLLIKKIKNMKNYPKKVQSILNSFNDENDTYQECKRIVNELNAINWNAEYYLDGELFNIKKIKK